MPLGLFCFRRWAGSISRQAACAGSLAHATHVHDMTDVIMRTKMAMVLDAS